MNIDLVVAPFFDSGVLPFPSYKRDIDWFPVWYNLKELKKKGIKVNFINYRNFKLKNLNNIVGIDCRIIPELLKRQYNTYDNDFEQLEEFLGKIKQKVDYLLWFDNRDSTGTPQFEVLPFVDRYYKKQLLKDRLLYTKNYYADRFHIDYYARNYEIEKIKKDLVGLNRPTLDMKYLNKISISWNCAMWDYRNSNSKFKRLVNSYTKIKKLNFKKPSANRKLLFSANFSFKSESKLIAFQRKALYDFLKEKYDTKKNVSIGYIPYKEFIATLKSSQAIFSPFYFGEICRRDFETFLVGAALIKPDMEHLETWPDIYKKNHTYIPISWSVEKWKDEISEILSDKQKLLRIAENGQKLYKKIWSKEGMAKFNERFIKMINQNYF